MTINVILLIKISLPIFFKESVSIHHSFGMLLLKHKRFHSHTLALLLTQHQRDTSHHCLA
jgi:hypothetical protein